MRKLKKKSNVLSILSVVLCLLVLIAAFVILIRKTGKFSRDPLGSRQMTLLETYQRGENALLYIDLSAKYEAAQSAYDLAQNGGFYEEFPCGTFDGFALWNNKTAECHPDYKKNFAAQFTENVNLRFILYEDSVIPLDNYNNLVLAEKENKLEIIGGAENPMKILVEKSEKSKGFISIRDLTCKRDGVTCVDGECSLTNDARAALIDAGTIAKNDGKCLYVTSSSRNIALQRKLYAAYVANPDENPLACNPDRLKKCPHVQGMAVDIGFSPHVTGCGNKEGLRKIMNGAGWVNLCSECWHFEFGTDAQKEWADLENTENKEDVEFYKRGCYG